MLWGMKVLRMTVFIDPGLEPMTTITRDSDFKDSLQSVRDEMIAFSEETFVAHDAVVEAMKRFDKQRARDMALTYFWNRDALQRMKSTSVMTMTRPAPLSVNELKQVLKQIHRCRDWRGIKIIQIAEDLQLVTLTSKGEIEVDS